MIDYSRPAKYAKNFQFDLRKNYPYVRFITEGDAMVIMTMGLDILSYKPAIIWCRETFEDRFTEWLGTFWFQTEEDRMLFVMRWKPE